MRGPHPAAGRPAAGRVRACSRPAALVVGALLTASLAACGLVGGGDAASGAAAASPGATGTAAGTLARDVAAVGPAWVAPRLVYTAPVVVDAPRTETVWPGSGDPVRSGDVVVLDVYAEDGRTHAVVSNTYAGGARAVRLDRDTLGSALYDTVVGRTPGTRVLTVQESDGVPLVTTVDVRAGAAQGEPVPPVKGDPVVTVGADGAPAVRIPDGARAPAELRVSPLIRGDGPQVREGQTVTVQLVGVRWDDGSVVESTWDALPVTFRLGGGEVIPGIEQGLEELPVGSRVLLVVPPRLAYEGTSSRLASTALVYVVDILDAHTPGTGPTVGATMTPQPTAGARATGGGDQPGTAPSGAAATPRAGGD